MNDRDNRDFDSRRRVVITEEGSRILRPTRDTIMSGCRAFTLTIVVAMPLLLTGCVNAPEEFAAGLSQSIADGLSSTVSSFVEAAFLAIAI